MLYHGLIDEISKGICLARRFINSRDMGPLNRALSRRGASGRADQFVTYTPGGQKGKLGEICTVEDKKER